MPEPPQGCARVTGAVAGAPPSEERPDPTSRLPPTTGGASRPSSSRALPGKWVLLCFYPGDFTFV
jgi:hypothetical protein